MRTILINGEIMELVSWTVGKGEHWITTRPLPPKDPPKPEMSLEEEVQGEYYTIYPEGPFRVDGCYYALMRVLDRRLKELKK